MRVSYSEDYYVPLPPRHPFPMGKFPALYQLLLAENLVSPDHVVPPRLADWSDLLLAHSPEYLTKLANGTLSKQEERRMGLPWSERLVHRSRLAVQGTINAAFMALSDGIAANLAGGTHHAFPDHGEGFCVLNDVAVAIRVLQRSHWIHRALVLDLDVHQGNGTAAVFAGDDAVFTFSMHGAKNYPFRKTPSSLDIELPDQTGDVAYLKTLKQHLPQVIARANPDIVFYLAGIDVMANDRFGRLALSRDGLKQRDEFVLEALHRAGLPVTLLLSGGYASTAEATAELHSFAHREAGKIFG